MENKQSSIIKIVACGLALVALFVSCLKEPIELDNPNTTYCTSYVHQFQTVWEGIDHTYVLWERHCRLGCQIRQISPRIPGV